MTAEKLQIEFPSLGWEQILTYRKELLDAFDRAKEKAKTHEVEVYHGKVAEAVFRKWLSDFLPKRYGVTSGYIISVGLKSTEKTPHYDVIIYDQLESPILWIEDSPDASSGGQSRAIPVEYVKAVLEIKSKFSSKTVTDAIEHLKDLLPLMSAIDEPQEKYQLHLPSTFCCGIVFFDLHQKDKYNEAALIKCIEGEKLRGFFGIMILRGEGHPKKLTGRITLVQSETKMKGLISKNKMSLLHGAAISKSIQITENLHLATMIKWTECNFSRFGFDLIALMQGKYEVGRISSFYGIGATPMTLEEITHQKSLMPF